MRISLSRSTEAIRAQIARTATRYGCERLIAELLWAIASQVRARGPHAVDDRLVVSLAAVRSVLETLPEEDDT